MAYLEGIKGAGAMVVGAKMNLDSRNGGCNVMDVCCLLCDSIPDGLDLC